MENLPQWNNTVMEWYNNKLIYMEMNMWNPLNTLRLRQNGRHYADDTFKCVRLDENIQENIWILINISLKFGPKGPINNNPVLVQIAIIWINDVSLLMHTCITRPQLVNTFHYDPWACITTMTLRNYHKPCNQWQHKFQMKAVLPFAKRLAGIALQILLNTVQLPMSWHDCVTIVLVQLSNESCAAIGQNAYNSIMSVPWHWWIF